jgi:hypothetical protein
MLSPIRRPAAYDIYTCSRCDRTYEDHTGDGAPDEDYSNTSISKLVVKVFSKLGTFAGKLIGFVVHLLDKALTGVDNVISKFNDYTAQIGSFAPQTLCGSMLCSMVLLSESDCPS